MACQLPFLIFVLYYMLGALLAYSMIDSHDFVKKHGKFESKRSSGGLCSPPAQHKIHCHRHHWWPERTICYHRSVQSCSHNAADSRFIPHAAQPLHVYRNHADTSKSTYDMSRTLHTLRRNPSRCDKAPLGELYARPLWSLCSITRGQVIVR
jgi:hypothetical protein